MSVKRVAIFNDLLTSVGGTEYYSTALAVELHKADVEVCVVSFQKGPDLIWERILRKNHVPLVCPTASVFRSRDPMKAFVSQVRDYFESWRPDVIHATRLEEFTLTWLLTSRRAKIPVIGMLVSEASPRFPYYSSRMKGLLNLCSAMMAPTIAVAKGLKEDLHYNGRVFTVPCLVLESSVALRNRSDYKSLATITRLAPEKGLEYLVAAISFVAERYPEIHLTIYGEGTEQERIEAMIAMFELDERVTFGGTYTGMTGVDEVIKSHDLFIFSSLVESFGIAAMEVIARGKPVISTDVGIIGEAFREHGIPFLVRRGDSREMAQRIMEAIEHPGRTMRIAEKCRRVYEQKFSVSKVIARTLGMYEEVVRDFSPQD